jgi:UDP-3-O-[3-hydroxymyristoyl] glucosamine N-acyltransferase
MKLSNYVAMDLVNRDGEFSVLGNANSNTSSTLCFADSIHYVEMANQNNNVSCLIVNSELATAVDSSKGLVISSNPRQVFYAVHEKLRTTGQYKMNFSYGRGNQAEIHPTAYVSDKAWVGNNTYIGPNVSILDNVFIGDDCFIEAGATIGGEGILYDKYDGNIKLLRHGGGVKIGNGVTVLSNAAIAKSIFPHILTTIGDHSIIGVSAIIGHEAMIGKNCVISGNSLVARGVDVGNEAWIGSSAVIREYIVIGASAKIKAGSIVVKDVKPNQEVSGNFAVEHRNHLRSFLKMEKGL